MTIFVMFRERACGMRVFWSAASLCQGLALQSYKGVASKWFWHSHPQWAKLLEPTFGAGHMIRGKHANMGEKQLEALPWRGPRLGRPRARGCLANGGGSSGARGPRLRPRVGTRSESPMLSGS